MVCLKFMIVVCYHYILYTSDVVVKFSETILCFFESDKSPPQTKKNFVCSGLLLLSNNI